MFDFLDSNKKRAPEMEKVAAQLGMSYRAKDEYGTKKLLGDFKLFKRGGRKKIKNIMELRDVELELDSSIFDYQYTISTGNSSVTHRQTVFFIQSKKLDLPQFLLKPEHFFHRIGTYLGMQDIDFESDPEFSKQNLLQGQEEDLVRKRMNEDIRQFFTIEKNWSLEGLNYFLIFYCHKRLLPPEAIADFYNKGKEVYHLLLKND